MSAKKNRKVSYIKVFSQPLEKLKSLWLDSDRAINKAKGKYERDHKDAKDSHKRGFS